MKKPNTVWNKRIVYCAVVVCPRKQGEGILKQNKMKITAAILLISAVLQSRNAISLVVNSVAQVFPDKSVEAIQLIFSVMTGAGAVGSFIAGKIAGITTKKNIVLFFSGATLAGALLAYMFSRSYSMLMLASVIIGIAIGTLTPISSALIAEYYEGSKRASMMGIQSLAINGGGFLITLLAGFLTVSKWENVYLSFIVMIPVILAAIFLLPQGNIEKEKPGKKVKVMNARMSLFLTEAFFFGVGLLTFTGNISFVVAEAGEQYAAWAGYAISIFMIGAVVAGLLLPATMKWLKEATITAGLAIGCMGLFCLAFSNSLVMVALCAALFGIGFGLYMPATFTIIPECVDSSAATMAMSLLSCVNTLGSMVNPYIVTSMAALINDNINTRFLLSGLMLCVVLLMDILSVIRIKKSKMK